MYINVAGYPSENDAIIFGNVFPLFRCYVRGEEFVYIYSVLLRELI